MGKTYYNISSKTDKAGESEIFLRVYVSKTNRIRVGSGIWVDAKRWGKKNDINVPTIQGQERELLMGKREKLKSLTEYLEKIVNTADDKTTIDKDYLEKVIRKFHKPQKAEKENVKSFFDIIEDYLIGHKLSLQRWKNFQVLKRALMRFELYKRKTGNSRFKLNISTLSSDQLREIEHFLPNEKQAFLAYPEIYDKVPYSTKEAVKTQKRNRPPVLDEDGNSVPKGMPRERGQNSVADMLTRFRAFYLWAIDNGYTTNNPFKHFTIGEIVYGTPIYISNEERKRLYETDMSDNPALATQRDIFIFQCLIGCRVSDLFKMTNRNIIDGSIEYIPRKTKEDRPITVRVPLNQTALDILARYRDDNRDAILPFYTEQKYNVKIKEAFKRAGLDRMVTTIDQRTRQEVQRPLYEIASSHMARRSFIGNIYKQVKDPNLVGALSGHKEGSKAFARYRTIDDDMRKELIGMLD